MDDDDLQLKQMRSVWLSMRDDDAEPGDRGMAALMAAARSQADAMKPSVSWWTKLLEQLRRPPVLAMATVVVLIGGAVVISQRGDEMRTQSEMAEPSATVASDHLAPMSPASEPVPTPATEAPGAERSRDLDETGTDAAKKSTVATQRPRPSATKPQRSAGPAVGQTKSTDDFSMSPEAPANPKPAAKKEDAKAPLELATGDEDLQTKGGMADSTSTAQPAPDAKPVTRKPLPSIEGEDRGAKDSSIAQLVKQCEAAAAKNDCAAVRTIAQKILKQDPSTYRSKVTKNAAVARCLEPPVPVEAAPATNAQ